MQVNIAVPWMVWARISQVFFNAQEVRRFVVHARSGILEGLKASLGVLDSSQICIHSKQPKMETSRKHVLKIDVKLVKLFLESENKG